MMMIVQRPHVESNRRRFKPRTKTDVADRYSAARSSQRIRILLVVRSFVRSSSEKSDQRFPPAGGLHPLTYLIYVMVGSQTAHLAAI